MADANPTPHTKGPALLDYSELDEASPMVQEARKRRRAEPSGAGALKAASTPLLARVTLFASAALLGLIAATMINEELLASAKVVHAGAPELPFEQDRYLTDLARFLPVQSTVTCNAAATCIVDESFEAWPDAQQRQGATAARTFLKARAIPAMMIRRADGTVLAAARRGEELRFFDPELRGADWEPEPQGDALRIPAEGQSVGISFLTRLLQGGS